MRKHLRYLGILLTAVLGLTLAACTATTNEMPTPTAEAMTFEEYLASPERDKLLREPVTDAAKTIDQAIKSGSLSGTDASVTLNGDRLIELVIEPTEEYPTGMTFKAPIEEQPGSLWVVSFDGYDSTVSEAGHETAREAQVHDLNALDALNKVVRDVG